MRIVDLFRRDEVLNPRVLVAGLDPRFEELVTMDSEVYRRFYTSTASALFPCIAELEAAISHRYDIVHLFCDVRQNGTIMSRENEMSGTTLLQTCCDRNVKILWIASDNEADRYISGFNARGKRINFVMTLRRNGSKFPQFLDKLLFRMRCGDTLPVAWSDLCPQIPADKAHSGVPTCIFFAGRGGAKFR
jgi:hypothetical protein